MVMPGDIERLDASEPETMPPVAVLADNSYRLIFLGSY